jgi:hypothetical protein
MNVKDVQQTGHGFGGTIPAFLKAKGKPGETPKSMRPCRDFKRVLSEHKL